MHFVPSYTLMYMYCRIFSRYKRRRRLWENQNVLWTNHHCPKFSQADKDAFDLQGLGCINTLDLMKPLPILLKTQHCHCIYVILYINKGNTVFWMSKKVWGGVARANWKALPSVKAVQTVTVPLDRKNGEKLESKSKICRPSPIRTL